MRTTPKYWNRLLALSTNVAGSAFKLWIEETSWVNIPEINVLQSESIKALLGR